MYAREIQELSFALEQIKDKSEQDRQVLLEERESAFHTIKALEKALDKSKKNFKAVQAEVMNNKNLKNEK